MAAAKLKSNTTAKSNPKSAAPKKGATKAAKSTPSKAPPKPSKAPPAKASKAPPAKPSKAPPAKAAKAAGKSKLSPPSKPQSIAPKAASIVPKAIAPKVTPAAAPLPERRSKIPPKFTVRSPADADERKAKIGALATAINQIKLLKRTLSKSFMDVGAILVDIRERKLFEVKGLSFESFVEREIELGKTMSLRLVRAVEIFHKPAALAAGMERVLAAVRAFDGDSDPQMTPTSPGTSPGFVRSPIPFHKR
jgi:hypothetical protein